MLIKSKELGITEEQCENTKKVVSKYGISMVCDEEETTEEKQPDLVLAANDNCEKLKTAIHKYGISAICEE